jgi:uncharacterized membrane protein YgcG
MEVARVVSGETLVNDHDREEIARAVALAEVASGVGFSVYVGDLGSDSRKRAMTLHGALAEKASDSVLLAVDPGTRRIEVVTGEHVKWYLDDRACALGIAAMTSSLAAGDLVGGIVNGLRTLAEHARHPRVLHTETE